MFYAFNCETSSKTAKHADAYQRLVARAKAVQELRPRLLQQLGYVPECVLEVCNADRALLRELGEDA